MEDHQYKGISDWKYDLVKAKSSPLELPTLVPVPSVSAAISFPDALDARIEIQHASHYTVKTETEGVQSEQSIGGAHEIEIEFYPAANFHGGGIRKVNSLSLKSSEGEKPTSLYINGKIEETCNTPLMCSMRENSSRFYAYLSHDPKSKAYNTWNMQVAKFFEISITFADGQAGTLVFGKSDDGEQSIEH
jgi:hypothetical protein